MKYALLNNKIEIHSTYHRSFTNIKSLARNWRDAGICPRYAIDSGHNMATCKSWYFNVFQCISHLNMFQQVFRPRGQLSSSEICSCSEPGGVLALESWLESQIRPYMAILRESPTLRDLGWSMDDYDLVFVYVDFITGLGMMAQNIATRRSRSNSQTHRMSLFCLMGNMGAHDRSDPMALPLGCCLGVVCWILKLVTIVSHTHTITRTPAIPAQMPLCSLFEQVFNLLVDISADVRAAAVTALSRMRDRGQASYSDC